ncbi:MAG: hypothetical protein ACTSXE_01105 [Candidatus Thorarchaeota archaeon]
MITYGPLFNPILLTIGALGLVILAVIAGLWKGKRLERYWIISALEVGGMLILWEVSSLFYRFVVHNPGDVFTETLADVGGYMLAAGTLVILEMYRDRERRFENYRRERMQSNSDN